MLLEYVASIHCLNQCIDCEGGTEGPRNHAYLHAKQFTGIIIGNEDVGCLSNRDQGLVRIHGPSDATMDTAPGSAAGDQKKPPLAAAAAAVSGE